MKTLLISVLLILSTQASAAWSARNISYQQAKIGQNIAMKLLRNSSEGEISLSRSYRISSQTDQLIVVSHITHGFSPDGRYQRSYQYICRQSRHQRKGLKLSASLCGELDYKMKLNRS